MLRRCRIIGPSRRHTSEVESRGSAPETGEAGTELVHSVKALTVNA